MAIMTSRLHYALLDVVAEIYRDVDCDPEKAGRDQVNMIYQLMLEIALEAKGIVGKSNVH